MKGIWRVLGNCAIAVLAAHLGWKQVDQGGDDTSRQALLGKGIGHLGLGRSQLSLAVEMAFSVARVPAGFASVHGCDPQPSYDFPVLGPTLGDALESLRKVAPDYDWRVEGGVVDLVPAGGFPAPLLTRVAEYDSKDANSLTWAAGLLLQLPEVRAAKSKLGFTEAPNEIQVGLGMARKYGTPPAPSEPPLAVRCRGCAVYEVLNNLIRKRGHGLWVYEEHRCGGLKTLRVSFSD